MDTRNTYYVIDLYSKQHIIIANR